MRVEQLELPVSVRSNGREPPRAHPLGSDVVALILVGFAYFALAYLGLRLASINPSTTPIWPPCSWALSAGEKAGAQSKGMSAYGTKQTCSMR
jgi:hypothetical protein